MSITVGGRQIREGDKFRITKNGEVNGFGFAGETITVLRIYDNHTIGIVSERYNPSWGDLDGKVEPGYGYYINPESFRDNNFEQPNSQYMVTAEYKYNELDLKGKTCKMLYVTRDRNTSFVEFEDNVGGGGCDGLGKHGHCIAMPSSLLSVISAKKAEKTTSKNKQN